jgi:hypothetical protein
LRPTGARRFRLLLYRYAKPPKIKSSLRLH